MNWPIVNIEINGEMHTGIAPAVLSASRSTDIPAFYASEFINHLKKGYLFWTNPFNGKKALICLSEVKFIVFWTKNAAPIIPFLDQIDNMGIDYYFSYTLNDYEIEGLESNLPLLTERINTFKNLSERIGKEKVIWRFDPLVLLKNQKEELLIKKIINIAENLYEHTQKLVISFVDLHYRKVQKKLKKSGITFEGFNKAAKIKFAQKLIDNVEQFHLKIASCAEIEDLQPYGIARNKCIDDELIVQIASKSTELVSFIEGLNRKNQLKDSAQRKHCRCMVSKDIGAYNSCYYDCIYCYAGHAKDKGKKNPEIFS